MRLNLIIGSICVGLLYGFAKAGVVLPSEKIISGLLYAAYFGLAACIIDVGKQLYDNQESVDRSYSNEKNRL